MCFFAANALRWKLRTYTLVGPDDLARTMARRRSRPASLMKGSRTVLQLRLSDRFATAQKAIEHSNLAVSNRGPDTRGPVVRIRFPQQRVAQTRSSQEISSPKCMRSGSAGARTSASSRSWFRLRCQCQRGEATPLIKQLAAPSLRRPDHLKIYFFNDIDPLPTFPLKLYTPLNWLNSRTAVGHANFLNYH